MIFVKELEIPANTAKASPEKAQMLLGFGYITRVAIHFPSGCAGLAYFRIKESLHVLYPTTPGVWFRADGETIPFNDQHTFFEPPYELTLQGYNLDDTFSHTIIARIEVLLPSQLIGLGWGGLPVPGEREERIPDWVS